MSVSVDGFEESFEWFRRGASWTELLTYIPRLADHSEVSINYAITPYTLGDYHRSKSFWKYPHSSYPIVFPHYTSLLNFPKSSVEKIPNYDTIPFYNLCAEVGNLNTYKVWSQGWDHKWGTPGWSEKLFPWIWHNAV